MIQNTRLTEAERTGYGLLNQQEIPVATVQSGETTLKEVANRLNLDVASLIKANPQIQDPNNLQTGQDVRLPETSAPAHTGAASNQQTQSNPAALPSGDPMSTTFGKMRLQPNAFFSV